MTLPRILVLDDLFFWSTEDRAIWCRKLGLADVTDGTEAALGDYVAEAVFQSAQVRIGNSLVNSKDDAVNAVANGWWGEESERAAKKWSLVLLDLQFDEGPISDGPIDPDTNWPNQSKKSFGLEILASLAGKWPDVDAPEGNCEVPVVMLSRLAREEVSRQAGRAGARAYIEKQDLTRELLEDILGEHGLIEDGSGLLIGSSLKLLKTLRTAREIGHNSSGNLLIVGETGSGKTVLGEYIHKESRRSSNDFHNFTVSEGFEPVGLNAELFGYWHGAFTDANQSEAGKAERANSSTLLIDEIGNLPKSSQGLLLEYCRLRSDGRRKLKRLGNFPTRPDMIRQANASLVGEFNQSTQEITVDVFLISATNARIDDPTFRKEVGFRDDLYYRLGEEYHKSITFPSLKARMDDVDVLFKHYLELATKEMQGIWPKDFGDGVLDQLHAYDWPGNVAQLKGVAREVAKNSKSWEEVSLRHFPMLSSRSGPVGAYIHPSTSNTQAKNVTIHNERLSTDSLHMDFDEVIRRLDEAEISSSRNGLQGKLSNLQEATGRLVMRLLEAALEETKDQKGELQPTSAVKRLLDRPHLPSTEAASHLLRLSKSFPATPQTDSNLALALQWAKKRRR